MKRAADQLRQAKADIQKNGWFHRPAGIRWGERNGCTCAAVALADACEGQKAERCFRKVIGQENIMAWNDHPDRTVEQVYEAFDKAIAIAEGK